MLIMFALLLQPAMVAVVPPQWIPSRVLSSDDYPKAAVLLGQEGDVQATVTVGADGTPIDCAVTHSSGYPALDSVTCAKLKARARFTPAKDNLGRPTIGAMTKNVSWRIEGNELPVAPWAIRVMAALDKRGNLTKCAIQAGGALATRTPMVVYCADLSGAFTVPSDLAQRYAGREAVLIFDQQFVPRIVNSIDTPKDLTRYPLVSRQVVRLTINALGQVATCAQTGSEGDYRRSDDGCVAISAHRFRPDRKALAAPISATATTAIYAYVN